MPQYRVTFKRTFSEYGVVTVEAEDEGEARDIGQDSLDDPDTVWSGYGLEDEQFESADLLDEGE